MAESRSGVLASFEFLDSIVDAIHELRKAGYRDLRAYSAYPEHHLEDALGYKESPVRVWTLVGGLTGAAAGFAFTTWTAMDWPLVTGGKPIVSIPTSVVIAFEMTVLFGALSTLIGIFVLSRLPHIKPAVIYDPEFMSGRFGLYVSAEGAQLDEARRILQRHQPALLTEDKEGAHAF
ncbi:MAG: DUF3341 domain-containing protein [Gemmatimonadetes bacterium]|nr:DUF3341 domain-containing protein [Gemmatimonadota bacterium]